MVKLGAALAGAGAAAAAAGALVGVALFAPPPDTASPEPAPPAALAARAAPEAAPARTAPAAAPVASAPPPAAGGEDAAPGAPAAAPRFDVVRVAPDGEALFAGVAEPGAEVEVRVGEQVVASARAGRDGGFVAFGSTAGAGGAGLTRIDLAARAPDGTTGLAADPVFVAPTSDAPDAAPPLVVRAEPERVAVVQAPTPAPSGGVTLDSVTYGEDGVVEVGGRADGLRRLRIWADALLIAETVAASDGRWMARAGRSLAPGAYTLRVEALTEDGRVAARTSSPFRREAAEDGPAPGQLVVQPGDSLWRLAQNAYGSGVRYTVIYDANADRIRNPDLIYPGQVFTLPAPPG